MKRKVLVINGINDLLRFDEVSDILGLPKYIPNNDLFIEALRKREDIDLEVVGRHDQAFTPDDLLRVIANLDPNQPLTVIILSHSTYSLEKGFEFIMNNELKISSKDLFTALQMIVPSTPIDIFTTAGYGAGIMEDKDILPTGSVLVGLTDKTEVNSNGDFDTMCEHFSEFSGDVTAYDLLQFYLSRFLKNRFHPHIGISGGPHLSLDDCLTEHMSKPLELDLTHYLSFSPSSEYLEVFNKILSNKSEWKIYADEYGLALSIILNDLKNSGSPASELNNKKSLN